MLKFLVILSMLLSLGLTSCRESPDHLLFDWMPFIFVSEDSDDWMSIEIDDNFVYAIDSGSASICSIDEMDNKIISIKSEKLHGTYNNYLRLLDDHVIFVSDYMTSDISDDSSICIAFRHNNETIHPSDITKADDAYYCAIVSDSTNVDLYTLGSMDLQKCTYVKSVESPQKWYFTGRLYYLNNQLYLGVCELSRDEYSIGLLNINSNECIVLQEGIECVGLDNRQDSSSQESELRNIGALIGVLDTSFTYGTRDKKHVSLVVAGRLTGEMITISKINSPSKDVLRINSALHCFDASNE